MKFSVKKRLAALAALAVVGGGGAAFAVVHADTVPNGITATEAYVDSISNVTATFGPNPGANALVPGVQIPDNGTIQFAAVSSLSTVNVFSWTLVGAPSGYTISNPGGVLTLKGTQPTSTDSFKVDINEVGGFGQAVATVVVTPGVASNLDSVTITIDDVTLGAPVNSGGQVSFPEPAGVNETLSGTPVGVVFANDTLSVGTAVAGHYPLMILQAKDALGSVATEGFTAVVGPFFQGVPVLYGGHAVSITAARENVYVGLRNVDACLHFQIVGPGKINGHEGWVPAHVGENVAVYGGLEGNHGYTVNYEPVTGPANCAGGSTTLWPGAHTGYVYFKTA